MIASRTVLFLRRICIQPSRPSRFTRDSIRNRIYRQELKDLTKKPPETPAHIHPDSVPVRPVNHLFRALGFTVAVGAGSYTIASIWDHERSKKQAQKLTDIAQSFFVDFTSYNWNTQQQKVEAQSIQELNDGQKCALAILLACCAVTAMWKVKKLEPLMWRYFSNSYASRSLTVPMALSVFSHQSLIHLGLNMYVMYTFSEVAINKFLGMPQFAAFFMTAGVFSSFTSLVHKALIRSPIRALGASGSIMALLIYTCMCIPDAKLQIVFVPGFQFSAQSAIFGLVLFDLAGLLLRFRLFDHAAHLGGSLFGIAYALWGEAALWGEGGFRDFVISRYKSLTDR